MVGTSCRHLLPPVENWKIIYKEVLNKHFIKIILLNKSTIHVVAHNYKKIRMETLH